METSKKRLNQLSIISHYIEDNNNDYNNNDHDNNDNNDDNKNKQNDEDQDDGIVIKRLHKNNFKLGNNHKPTNPLHQKDMSLQNISLPNIHPLIDKTHVPLLQPLVIQGIHEDACVDIIFTHNNSIFTSDRRGCVKHWCK